MKRNTTGLHVRTKLQRARAQAGYRKLAGGGPVLPSSYPRDALGYSPTDFQPAALLPSVAPGATQPADQGGNLALLAGLKAGVPLIKNALGLTSGTPSNSLGLGSSLDNLLAGGIGKGGEVTDGLLGSGGQLFGTVNPETGLPVGGVSIGQIGTGLGGLGGIAGGIMGLTNLDHQNGIGIAGDVAQLGGGAAALGSSLGLIGAAGGPIGLAVAGIGALASSLFGNKKPHNISGLVINSVGGDGSLAPLAVGNDNGADTGQLQDLLSKVAQPYLQALGKQYGIDLSGVNIGAFAHKTEGKGDFSLGFTGPVPGQSFAIDPNNIAGTTPQALQQLGQAMLDSWQQLHPDQKLPSLSNQSGATASTNLQGAPPPRPEPALVTADDIKALYAPAKTGSAAPADGSSLTAADIQKLYGRAEGGLVDVLSQGSAGWPSDVASWVNRGGLTQYLTLPSGDRLGSALDAGEQALGNLVRGLSGQELATAGLTAYADALSGYDAEGREIPQSQRALTLLGSAMPSSIGSLAAPIARSGTIVGAGPVSRTSLPMDEASRMARAREMGFRTDMPLYHGTDADITAFDKSLLGRSGTLPSREGFFLALDPDTASYFAQMAASREAGPEAILGANVLPLLHRSQNPGRASLASRDLNPEVAATLNWAFHDLGHDAILLRNYTTPGSSRRSDILVVKEPSQLRSRFAAFDPAKRDSPDLLAGLLPLAPLADSSGEPDQTGSDRASAAADDIRRLYGRADGGLVGVPLVQRLNLATPDTLDLIGLLSQTPPPRDAHTDRAAPLEGRIGTGPLPGIDIGDLGSITGNGLAGTIGRSALSLGLNAALPGLGTLANLGVAGLNTYNDVTNLNQQAEQLGQPGATFGEVLGGLGRGVFGNLIGDALGFADPANVGRAMQAANVMAQQQENYDDLNASYHELEQRGAPPTGSSISPDDTSGGPSAWGGERGLDNRASMSPDAPDTNAYGGERADDGRESMSPDSTGTEGREGREGTENAGGEGGEGAAQGGRIGDRAAFSGLLKGPGTPTSDSIPTRLTSGGKGPMVSRDEFVVNARTVRKLGPRFLYGLQQLAARQSRITPDDIRALYQETKMGFPTEGMSRYRGINAKRLPPSKGARSLPPMALSPIAAGPMQRPQIGQPMMPPITASDLKALFAAGPGLAGPQPRLPAHLARGGYIRRHLDEGGTVGAGLPSSGSAFSGGASTSGMTGSAPADSTSTIVTPVAGAPNVPPPNPFDIGHGGGNGLVRPTATDAGSFDPKYYLQANADVRAAAQAAGGDQNAQNLFALNHWLQYGQNESRPVNAQEAAAVQKFAAKPYLDTNQDVFDAVNQGQFDGGKNAALQHFVDFGFFEGRNPAGQARDSGHPLPTAPGGGVVPPDPQPAQPIGLTRDDVISIFHQLFRNGAPMPTTPGVASSFVDPTTGATVTQQGPAQNAVQVLNALSPARGNRFASEYAAPTFWG